jgi:membrane protease YdiL (CAAX protease family)
LIPPFVLSVFGGTFMLTWIFNETRGSVLLPMLFHASINTIGAGLIFPLFPSAVVVLLWWIYGVVWLCIGLGVLLFSGKQMRQAITGRAEQKTTKRTKDP